MPRIVNLHLFRNRLEYGENWEVDGENKIIHIYTLLLLLTGAQADINFGILLIKFHFNCMYFLKQYKNMLLICHVKKVNE